MPGQIKNYRILRTLGSGASCKVKLGQDTKTGRKVAIKIMSDFIDAKIKELIVTEIKAMTHIEHHDNII
jgi:serine/threonine protein kinase